MEARTRQGRLALGTAGALVAWAVLVVLAVEEGRALRGDEGSIVVLAVWSLAAMACLYAALALLLTLRRASSAPGRGGRHTGPRH